MNYIVVYNQSTNYKLHLNYNMLGEIFYLYVVFRHPLFEYTKVNIIVKINTHKD